MLLSVPGPRNTQPPQDGEKISYKSEETFLCSKSIAFKEAY